MTGEVGTGKTLLCRKLLSELGSGACPVRLAWLPNPHLTPGELRTALALELGLAVQERAELDLTDRIHRHLITPAPAGSRVVVLIDEAQALPDETLEAIRLFGNLETGVQQAAANRAVRPARAGCPAGQAPPAPICASASASPYCLRPAAVTRPGPIWAQAACLRAIAGRRCLAAPALRLLWRASAAFPAHQRAGPEIV